MTLAVPVVDRTSNYPDTVERNDNVGLSPVANAFFWPEEKNSKQLCWAHPCSCSCMDTRALIFCFRQMFVVGPPRGSHPDVIEYNRTRVELTSSAHGLFPFGSFTTPSDCRLAASSGASHRVKSDTPRSCKRVGVVDDRSSPSSSHTPRPCPA